jgi:membrane protease YdiL (CAAX protease family)
MQIKSRIHLLGLITLLVFPIPAFWALWYFEAIKPWKILDFNNLINPKSLIGLSWGIIYAILSMRVFQLKIFGNELDRQEKLIQSMNLNLAEKIFLSFCAGFGEEILFRAGVQHWLGIWITSILFIAIHGYLNPKKWRLSLYGILLLPFILSLGFWLAPMGIWFCIAAHFSYDLVLFISIDRD